MRINGTEETTASADTQSSPGYNPQEEVITEPGEKETVLEKNSRGLPILPYNCSVAVIEPDANGKMKKIASINVEKPQDEDIYYMEIAEMYVKDNDLVIIARCSKFDEEIVEKKSYAYYDTYYAYEIGYNVDITMAACFDISS